MKKSPLGYAVILLFLPFCDFASAQAKRCDLTGALLTDGNGIGFKKCLDVSTLDGKTLTIPQNVTRIDNDGLALCRTTIQEGGDADIVYVMDQSGSMYANFVHISPSGDTTYIERMAGCNASPAIVGKITLPYSTGTRTVDLLDPNGSIMGCPLAGDPFAQRGVAFKAAIDYQAQQSPQSTAGYIGFNSSIVEQQSLLQLTPANVTILKNTIGLKTGGTNYKPPLERSKQWLTNTSLIKTQSQAVIFLSDGQPFDSYLDVLSPTYLNAPGIMPPIFGIFLGNPNAAYQKLEELSSLTGGRFYLIPPNRPDSLKTVVEEILNLILLEFQPISATVSNKSLIPVQNSLGDLSGMTKQSDGSWLIKLDSAVAIQPGNNEITVTSHYREIQGDSIRLQNIRFWLNATGGAETQNKIVGGGAFSTQCHDPSTLQIRNAQGLLPAYLTELDTAYRVHLNMSQSSLTQVTANALAVLQGDDERLAMSGPTLSAGRSLFQSSFPFRAGGSHTDFNGRLESSAYDSLLVTWRHPRDPRDMASGTMKVQAAFKAAEVYFAATSGGEKITNYPISQKTVFVVVKDQVWNPSLTYTVQVKNNNFGEDRETLSLTQLSPGVYGAQVPVEVNLKVPHDGKFQMALAGDQLTAIFVDPVYKDTATGNAGFDRDAEVAAKVDFTNSLGVPLPPDAIYSPSSGRIYLRYEDDRVFGTIPTKKVSLLVNNKKYGDIIGTDFERVTVTLQAATGNQGVWTGSIPLKDVFPAQDSNGTVETRFRGEITASVLPHSNQGVAGDIPVTDFLVVAYADIPAVIEWAPVGPSVEVPPGQEAFIVKVTDQPFTTGGSDSLRISVKCLRSGDGLGNILLIEDGKGSFTSVPIFQNNSNPNFTDAILSCQNPDEIEVTYIDPVFGTITTLLIRETAPPVANPSGRNFLYQLGVVLTSPTPDARIYYTLDGTRPDTASTLYTGPIPVITGTTLRAVAVKTGWKNSKELQEVYVKQFTPSRLEILDQAGNPLAGGALTQRDSLFMVKIITTQGGLSVVQPEATTRVLGDKETLDLSYKLELPDRVEYRDLIPLKITTGSPTRVDTVEAFVIDTLRVFWRNPLDSNDVAEATVLVRPAFQAAEVYFSQSEGGPRTTRFPADQDTVFIVIKDQPGDPRLSYTVDIFSSVAGDTETRPLTELSPGTYSTFITIGKTQASKGDGILQVSPASDQLTAVFKDPIYLDVATGNAGFDEDVQESGVLVFTDSEGAILPPGHFWNPEAGKIFVRYYDDWNPAVDASLATKQVNFSLSQKKSQEIVGTDTEAGTMALIPANNTATRGTWSGQFNLADLFPPTPGNSMLETYYRGELTASVVPHNNAGTPLSTQLHSLLLIAYPDKPATIRISDADNRLQVDRLTGKLRIRITDQVFSSSGTPTLTVQASCAGSGDQVNNVVLTLIDPSGIYETKTDLIKGEWYSGAPDKGDGILSCKESDIITVHYTDPVYGTQASENVRYEDVTPTRIYFASITDTSEIKSLSTTQAGYFLVVVESKSPTRNARDTLAVILIAPDGEKETVSVIETAPFSGVFVGRVPFGFALAAPTAGNGKIEGKIDNTKRINSLVTQSEITVDGKKYSSALTLVAEFNLVQYVYVKDLDGDGRVDRAYFAFDRKLGRLPTGIDPVYWNEESLAKARKAGAAQISFVNNDSTLVMADFSANPFAYGLTGWGRGDKPTARFPSDELFGGQKPILHDSVGPVIISALKKPSDLSAYDYSETEKRFNPDTLVVEVSERMRTLTHWKNMLRFTRGCGDYSASIPLITYGEPILEADGVTWTIIVDNTPGSQTPVLGDCVFLTVDGRYLDEHGNRPPVLGMKLEGKNPKMVIRQFRAYPPVAGLDPNSPEFILSMNETRTEKKGEYGLRRGETEWIMEWMPPYGFTDVESFKPYMPSNPGEPARNEIEYAGPVPMPKNISTVQIITTGKYIAFVTIYDHLGQFVNEFKQSFGYHGEMRNPNRSADQGMVSYLVWNMKDTRKQPVGNGAYVWKVNFYLENQKQEVQFIRTGLIRR